MLSCSPNVHMKAVKSTRPKTDIIVMTIVLGVVVIWCNEEGFNKHIK